MLATPASFSPLLYTPAHTESLSFVFCNDQLVLSSHDASLPSGMILHQLGLSDAMFQPLGLWNGAFCRAVSITAPETLPDGFQLRRLRSLLDEMPDEWVAVAARGYQIAEWARTHRFCGVCGNKTVIADGNRSAACPACGHNAYPRISPVMMVLIKKGSHILLARHAGNRGTFVTALAGFLEAGESIEEAVHREVAEEVGLKVKNLTYFGSQPWPFPHSLMVAFTAEYDSGEIVVDTSEIAEAKWYGPSDPPPDIPSATYSVAGRLIRAHGPWPNT